MVGGSLALPDLIAVWLRIRSIAPDGLMMGKYSTFRARVCAHAPQHSPRPASLARLRPVLWTLTLRTSYAQQR